MNPEQKIQRNRILKEPVNSYLKKNSTDKDTLSILEELSLQYTELKQKQKQNQDLTQKLSREIGAAKKSGYAIDELKSAMQAQSSNTKKLKTHRHNIETKILNYFNASSESLGEDPSQEKSRHKDENEIIVRRQYNRETYKADEINVALLTDAAEPQWNEYVENHPHASIYHRHEWGSLIHKTFGHSRFYFYAFDTENTIVGILPLIRLNSRLFGDFMVSVPYFNYGGAIADHPEVELALMNTANIKAQSLGVKHIEYRDDIAREGYPVRNDKVNMILALPASSGELWKRFTPKLRAQIKRPQREKPESELGGQELLDDFYQVFSRNMRDLGTPVYSKLFFANILNQLADNSHILVLRLRGRPVAAAFLIGYKDRLEIPWASTVRSVSNLSMNMLMYWNILCFAIEKKYAFFDFGRSSKDSGTYRFKKQWGAKAKPLYWHYWLPEGEALPALNPANPKFALMINIWKRLPIFITKLIGPGIVKNLP